MEKKSLDYYLNLDYDLTVIRLEDEGEHIYKAYARELGEYAIYGTGNSKMAAIESFEASRTEMFKYYYENNIAIHEPQRQDEEKYSGKFIVRTTPDIHRILTETAAHDNISLNQLINNVLHTYCAGVSFLNMAEEALGKLLKKCGSASQGAFDSGNIYDLTDHDLTKPWQKKNKMAAG
ncbi:hypothetical protein TRIP_C20464 [Candidatus Zixiibacteriota bacterium]|nr:hypothetical protein TRIP_C20464 [candidate division Zixibacteria bacterium]